MEGPFNHDQVKGWLGLVLSVVERATPLTLLFALLTGGLFGFYMLKRIEQGNEQRQMLYTALMAAKDAQLAREQEFRRELTAILQACQKP